MIEFLSENWIGSLIGLIGIIISAIVSYYFYRKSVQKALPTFQRKTVRVIDIKDDVNLDNIEITYKERKINRLERSYIVFWNDGNKTIDGKDILEKDKIRVVFGDNDEGEILSINTAKRTRDVTEFDAKVNPENSREILLSFNFLDAKDGAIIEVLHTFDSKPRVIGTIKGIPQGIKNNGVFSSIESSRKGGKGKNPIDSIFKLINSNVVLGIYIVLGIFFVFYGIKYDTMPKFLEYSNYTLDRIALIIIGITFIFPITILKFTLPKQRFPKTLMLEEY